jgi:hypothetical protein
MRSASYLCVSVSPLSVGALIEQSADLLLPPSESESKLFYDWRFTANHFVLPSSPLRLTTTNSFQLSTCGYSPYVAHSLTRGLVCSLQLLLALVSAVILRFESREIHDHTLLSQIRDSPNLEGQVHVFISSRTGWPNCIPRHWIPFSSPPMTRRAKVEVYEPDSIRD